MEYDIIIIGSGPGGYVAAIRAAQLGCKVAIVERAELGGVCLNWGCIPTKALLKSAQVFNSCKEAANYGVELQGEPKPDMERIVARSREVAATMNRGVDFLLKKANVEILQGFGSLIDPHTVEVDSEHYKAKNIILATGAHPRSLPSIVCDGEHIITSREALTLQRVPESIIIVGSGAIGSEFAYLYSTLGAKVTIVEYQPRLMPLEDEEVSKSMERAFRKQRITVATSTSVESATFNSESGVCEVKVQGKKGEQILAAEVVLMATGVEPNTQNLGLESVGVELNKGKVVVDSHYRSSVESIYAIGDIIATTALAHVASAEAIHCVEHICALNPEPIDYNAIPSCIYTSPEVASVGRTEEQMKASGEEYSVGRFPFTASGKATAAGCRDGFAKLIFDKDDKLVGAHLVGANVTEMIAEPTLAARFGITAHQIAKTVHAHPTLNESIMEAAEAAMGSAIHL